MANPSLSRQFTLTNFTWKLRANGHLNGEKIGAVNYLKLSRIPNDIRIYWNSTNNRDTAFSVDELVRGFKINERDEAGNAKTLDNVWLWSEGEIPIEPLSDIIEIEYNGAGDLIEPLLGNKSGAIDKIEKVQVVSAIDKILNPIKVVQTNNTQGYQIDDFYRINANSMQPILEPKSIKFNLKGDIFEGRYFPTNFGFYTPNRMINNRQIKENINVSIDNNLSGYEVTISALRYDGEIIANLDFVKDLLDSSGKIRSDFSFGLSCTEKITTYMNRSSFCSTQFQEGNFKYGYYDSSRNTSFFSVGEESEHKLFSFFRAGFNNGFLKCLEIVDYRDANDKVVCKGEENFFPKDGQIFGKIFWETKKDDKFNMFIFKTKNKTSYIAPANDEEVYISLIANLNNKKADFKITLAELSKASTQDCALYIGGLDGIKVPIKSGFELCFNNKKIGMDYAVIEIPAGDIYKIEIELLNVYEDSSDE